MFEKAVIPAVWLQPSLLPFHSSALVVDERAKQQKIPGRLHSVIDIVTEEFFLTFSARRGDSGWKSDVWPCR